jgi:hypothetical protein
LNKGISKKGKESLSLEPLAKANNIEMRNAHDAICDVEATIAILKMIKTKNPTLYQNVNQIVNPEYVQNFLNHNKLFLMKLANNSKQFTPFLFLGFDQNDQKRVYAYNLSNVKTADDLNDFKMIKTFKVDQNPMIQELNEDLPINSKCEMKDLHELAKTSSPAVDFDLLINQRKESFQNDSDEIFDPEEKIFDSTSINDQELINADLQKLSQIAEEVENPNNAFLLKKIVFEENPELLSTSDQQSIYEILRERLLTNGFTYFTNIAEAEVDQNQVKKVRLNEDNKHVFESYNEYLKQLSDYFSNPTFTHKYKFTLV